VLVSTATELDDQGRLRRILAAVKDVTEQKQAQREMAAAYEEIARLKDELQAERDYLREQEEVSMNFGRIVGSSPALRQMLARIEAVAGTNATVLVTGESGVGKELVARAIHGHSTRSGGPLVKVNCPSVPRELFESEFFGHVKGAFTGAHRDRIGRFQLADGGTLFLDEVGEIPIELQGKLLRVLQEQEFERVGEDSTRSVDVRVIAATNRDLAKEVSAGRFREDLFYRLAVFPVNVPPLRERREDIPQLARHFLEQAARDLGREVPALTTRQLDELTGYGWPGNVRELKNVLERAVILASGGRLRLDLGGRRGATVAVRVQDLAGADAGSPGYLTEAQLRRLEQENLRRVLELTGGRVAGPRGAAKLLGLKPSTLRDRVKSLGLAASPRA
jgi:transcriptional regulator with GAF, ATPase, and Fis domain